jgi:DNA-binding transcriptional ArsR family regulator
MMLDVTMIDDPAAAEASLDPTRARLLAEPAEPASATMLAARLGLARQKVNYHLRALERHGLVELVAERRKGNVTERLLRATAAAPGGRDHRVVVALHPSITTERRTREA